MKRFGKRLTFLRALQQLEAMKRKLLSVEEQQEEINEGDNVATGDAAPAKNASAAPAPSNGNANGAAATTSASAPTVHQRPSVADAEAAVAESDGRSVYVGNVSDSLLCVAPRVEC